ncbi:MAG: transposase [Bacteroidota bacterium]
MKKKNLKTITSPRSKRYSLAFKLRVVREYEQGYLNKDQLKSKYNIGGKSQILDWLRKYGKLSYPNTGFAGARMKDPQKQRIKELEKQLKEAETKAALYDKMIEIAENEMGVDIRKKFGAEQSSVFRKKTK